MMRFLRLAWPIWILSTLAVAAPAIGAGPVDASARPPTVVLIVLDAVRGDRVTPCGYTRPTTPNLARLAEKASTYCRMVAPGSWTVPVHASLFTGQLPTAHGADFFSTGGSVPGFEKMKIGQLRQDLPTLAERFHAAGYETVLVAGNPLISPSIGLTRGFDIVETSSHFASFPDGAVYGRVERVLEEARNPARPLFLFVNVVLAHGPFEAAPAQVGWVRATAAIDLFRGDERSLYARFLRGGMEPAERKTLIDDLREVYDWGVHLADSDLGHILRALERSNRIDDRSIIAVTSDHGEFLGEHGLLDHGRSVERENIDVFAVVRAPGLPPGRRFDHLVQSQDLFATLLEAAGLPATVTPTSVALRSEADPDRIAFTVTQPDAFASSLSGGRVGDDRQVAVERGASRAVWTDPSRIDEEWIARMASSDRPAPSTPDLAALAERLGGEARKPVAAAADLPADLVESLRALGYVD